MRSLTETVYCLAKCSNTTCDQHNKFKPQHGDNATADFSVGKKSRCADYIPVKEWH